MNRIVSSRADSGVLLLGKHCSDRLRVHDFELAESEDRH